MQTISRNVVGVLLACWLLCVSRGAEAQAVYVPPTSASATLSSLLGYFDVTAYGAVGNNTTDDTTAFQNAINAAAANGGGVVWVPPGKTYKLSGALQNPTRENSILILPERDVYLVSTINITLMSSVAPVMQPNPSGTTIPPASGHAIIRATTTGSGTNPSIIAGHAPAGSTNGVPFDAVQLTIKNLEFQVNPTVGTYTAPTLGCINAAYCTTLYLDCVVADAGTWSLNQMPNPHTAGQAGIITPYNNNGAWTEIGSVLTMGFDKGIIFCEHANASSLNSLGCYVGVAVAGAYHSSHIKRICAQHDTYGVSFVGALQTGDPNASRCSIGQLDIEHNTSGDNGWWKPVYDVYDPSNYGKGTIQWAVTTGNVGITSDLLVSGGSGLTIYEQGAFPVTSGGAAPAAPAAPTVTAANGYNKLTWTSVTGATKYNVLRSTTSGSGYVTVATGFNATQYTDSDLTNATQYYYVIQAANTSSTSANGAEASGTPTGTGGYAQAFDAALTAPTSWVFSTLGGSNQGASAHSANNVVAYGAAGFAYASYNVADSNAGDEVVSCWVRFNGEQTNVVQGTLGARDTVGSTLGSANYYGIDLQGYTGATAEQGLSLAVFNAGSLVTRLSPTGVGGRVGFSYFSTAGFGNKWYRLTLALKGSTLSARLYDPAQGKWIDKTSTWQTYPVDAITVVDTSVASGSAGYNNFAIYSTVGNSLWMDDFVTK